MTTQWYLGKCFFPPRPFTRVLPLAFSANGNWRFWDNWPETFPGEGKVFSANHPTMSLDTVFVFDTEAFDSPNKDKFRLRTLRPAEEVLNFTDVDPEETRRALVERGIERSQALREDVIVALPDDLCVRLTLVIDQVTQRSVAELHDLERLALYELDDAVFDGESIDGRWYSVPDRTVGAKRGTVDWSRDKDFIGSLLRQLKKVSTPDSGQSALPTTKSQIESFLTTLDRQNLLPVEQGNWRSANERVWHLAKDLKLVTEQIDEIVAVLGALTPVERMMADFLDK